MISDADLWQRLPDALATRNRNFGLPELVENLFRAMTFSWHFYLPSIHPVSDLSTDLVFFGQVINAEDGASYTDSRTTVIEMQWLSEPSKYRAEQC